MGCHTWYYRKIERSQKEAKESCLANLRKSRNLGWKIFKNPKSYLGIDWDITKEEQLKYIQSLNRKIRMVSNDLLKRAVWNHQNDKDITLYIDDKGLFIEDTEYHDLFRIGGYPEDQLFSYTDTIEYLTNNDSSITYGNYTRQKPEFPCINGLVDGEVPIWYEVNREEHKIKALKYIKEFWDKFPDGLIEFG